MRIGIDATGLPANPVGAGKYTIELVRSLSRIITGDEVFVFVQHEKLPLLGFIENERIHLVLTNDVAPSMRLIWEQVSLPRLVHRYRLDILHSPHYTMPLACPCRTIVTFHDMTFFLFPEFHVRAKRFLFPFFIRASAYRANHLIAVSESTRQDAIRILDLPCEKISTILEGVDPEFRPICDESALKSVRMRYGLPPHFVLFVGLLEPRKNLPVLMQAYRQIASQIPEHHLVIVGRKGWMYEEVLSLVESLSLRQQVHFTGYVAPQDLPYVYNLADVFVYPSIYEGFGLPVLEAMACGTPVITSNVSSMSEIAANAAELVSPADQTALANVLLRLLYSPDRRQQLSELGLQRAKSLPWERTARETLDLYRRVGINSNG